MVMGRKAIDLGAAISYAADIGRVGRMAVIVAGADEHRSAQYIDNGVAAPNVIKRALENTISHPSNPSSKRGRL